VENVKDEPVVTILFWLVRFQSS